MNALTLAALAALLAAAPPDPSALPVEIVEAGEVAWDRATGRWFLSGGAVLRRGAVTLRAGSASYDPATGTIDASGGVLLLEPGRALAAATLHAIIDGPYEARDVIAFTKEGPLDLSSCRTLDEAEEKGRNRATFAGARVSGRAGDPDIDLARPRVTLCDCGGGPPSWEIRASRADVIPGRRAWLYWPVLWVTPRFVAVRRPVPVLAFPIAYVPLAERQSGLLPPAIAFPGTGTYVSFPLYLAPSESWDATISYEQSFGARTATTRRQIRGPGGRLELRWAPTEQIAGTGRLFWLQDESRDFAGARPHGERVSLTLRHAQPLPGDVALRVDVGVVNDPLFLRDFTGDLLVSAAQYHRSSAHATQRREDVLLALEGGYHLPYGTVTAPYGLFGSRVPVLHRVPSFSATLLPVPVRDPLRLSVSATASRFAPIHGSTGDAGADGVLADLPAVDGGVRAPDAGERDGRWQPGERVSTTRAAARAELRAPMAAGRLALVEPWVAAFAGAYAFGAGRDPASDARTSGGIAISTRLQRRISSVSRHEVQPQLEWRAGSGRLGPRLPAPAWDELDAADPTPASRLSAVPSGGFQQAVASVRNRLRLGPALALDLTLSQDLDVDRMRLAETSVETRVGAGRVNVVGQARFRPTGSRSTTPAAGPVASSWLDRFTVVTAAASVADRRGDSVGLNLSAVGPTGSERLAAGLEPLFDPRVAAGAPIAVGTASTRLQLGGASLTYSANFNARSQPICDATRADSPRLYQHSAVLAWDSPCRCFKIAAVASYNVCERTPRFSVQFGLDELTSVGLTP